MRWTPQNGTSFDPLSTKAKGGLYMTKTENCNLPQWEAHDPVRREDFNGAMANIDAGITAARQAAGTAQGAAEKAQAAVDTLPYLVGTYVGNGYGTRAITLGFKPSLVLISGEGYSDSDYTVQHTVIATEDAPRLLIEFTETGFNLRQVGDYMPYLNTSNLAYRYIAFK